MNRMRSLFAFASFILLTVVALPSVALDKEFSVTLTSLSETAHKLVYLNDPDGSSNVNSLALTVPGATIQSAKLTVKSGNKTSTYLVPNIGLGTGHIEFWNIQGFKPGGTGTLEITIASATTSCSAVTLIPAAYTGNTLGGVPFTLINSPNLTLAVGCDGVLACNTYADGAFGASTIFRGENKNLSACVLVGYEQTNCINDGASCGGVANSYIFAWTANQPAATFNYPVVFQPEPDSATFTTKVAWPDTPSGPITMTPVAAQMCLSNSAAALPQRALPASYGKLGAQLLAGQVGGTISIVPTLGSLTPPATGSFPIVIGLERFLVSSAGGTNYSVLERGVADTDPADHAADSPVASTPFPLRVDPEDQTITIDRMCVSEIVKEIVPWGSGYCTPAWNGLTACVRYTFYFSDGGDGWALRN